MSAPAFRALTPDASPPQDPVLHVSIASVQGDVTHLIGPSYREPIPRDHVGPPELVQTEAQTGVRSEQDEEEDEEIEEEDVPTEVSVEVEVVACKAGTTVYCAPLCGAR